MSVQDVQNWQTALNSVLHVQATRKYARIGYGSVYFSDDAFDHQGL